MKKTSVNPKRVFSRSYEGVPLYAQAVTVEGGRLSFISGQISRDESGNLVGQGDMRAQIEQVARNIGHCLREIGAGFEDIVKTVAYVTDIDEYSKHVDLRARYFAAAQAASSTVEVRKLAGGHYLVEIEALVWMRQ